MSFKEKFAITKNNISQVKKINDAKEIDVLNLKNNKFLKRIIFDNHVNPDYDAKVYIKGLPSDFETLNEIDLRISKMKFDKYFFSPNFHRISNERDVDENEITLWVLLSTLVLSHKSINFPLVYCTTEKKSTWKAFFERIDHTNILTRISNKPILLQVGLILYNMYKNRVWCASPIFDMIDISKTKVIFKVHSLGFTVDLHNIIVLSYKNRLENLHMHEDGYLYLFYSIVGTQFNRHLNRPYNSFIEFFIFEFYNMLVPQVLVPLKQRSTEITSPSIISAYHKAGTFVQFKYYEKIYTGVLLERLVNPIGDNFNNCIIAFFNENIEIALVNEQEVYINNGPVISFINEIVIGE